MPHDEVVVRLRGVTKDYRGLRPLRITELDIHAGQSVALVGLDGAMAEVLVDLITGAALPDSGEIVAFGRRTSDIVNVDDWMSTLDAVGLLTDRAALVDRFTVEQNLALPFSVAIDDMPSDVRARVRHLARELEIGEAILEQPAGAVAPDVRARIRLGRALALGPRVMLAEHPNATLSREDAGVFAALVARIIASRGIASVTLTADRGFAQGVAREVLEFDAATGVFKPMRRWRRWFSS
jgi:ABC-type transporter Mla maintaining outer membrane lipid asymmetry ATPase subunit MlaF